MDYCYKYPRPAVTVDAVVLAPAEKPTHVLLIQRKNEPFRDLWAFPGGFVDENEDPEDAVGRELEEETGLTGLTFAQAGFYGRPGRDPRGHTVSLAFVTRTNQDTQEAIAADDAKDVRWHPLADLPPLAFDHAEILSNTLEQEQLCH
ncbi:NUDIX hydrolase [Roseibacillus persicicus]|uniref:NUDIX domain-containing protein n=1 Tax=Roseibacillus persicicus TaxID=454148 RepID=UPI00398AD9DC